MHQSCAVTDEERVRFSDGEIIHRLHAGFQGQRLNHSRRPVPLHHPLARAQIGRRDPSALHRVKRMRKRGFQRFPVNHHMHHERIDVMNRINHGGDAHDLGGFIPRQHQITDLELRNRNGARRRRDGRAGAEAVLPAQPRCFGGSVVSAPRASGNAAYAPPARDSARHTGASSPAAEASGFRAFMRSPLV